MGCVGDGASIDDADDWDPTLRTLLIFLSVATSSQMLPVAYRGPVSIVVLTTNSKRPFGDIYDRRYASREEQ